MSQVLFKWLKFQRQRFVLITGGPGSGKSTALLKFARLFDNSIRRGRCESRFFECSDVRGGSIDSARHSCKNAASAKASIVSVSSSDQLNAQGKLALLIDGLDEVPPQAAQPSLRIVPLVWECSKLKDRTNVHPRSLQLLSPHRSMSVIELDPPTPDQIHRLLARGGKVEFRSIGQLPDLDDLALSLTI